MGDLPQLIVLKPVSLKKYVCYESDAKWGQVHCRGKSVFDENTKIGIEPARDGENLFHLRFCHSNRYLGQCAEDERAIAAVSKHPVEDVRKQSCTLFKLSSSVDDEEGAYMTMQHFRSGLTVFMDEEKHTRLSLRRHDDDDAAAERFNYVNWDQLVWIPERVRFRGPNRMFLRGTPPEPHPYLRFDGPDDVTDQKEEQRAFQQPDGHYRFKSVYHDRFWKRDPDSWILADASEGDNSSNTLFWPEKRGDQTIALLNQGNSRYLTGAKDNNYDLKAAALSVIEDAEFVVEEIAPIN